MRRLLARDGSITDMIARDPRGGKRPAAALEQVAQLRQIDERPSRIR